MEFKRTSRHRLSFSNLMSTRRGRQYACFTFLFVAVVVCIHALWSFSSGYRGWTTPISRIRRTYAQWRGLTASSFKFSPDGPPPWLTHPAPTPLVLRIAVMSVADEFETRAFLRDRVYRDVPRDDVQFVVKFFVARQPVQSGGIFSWQSSATEVDRRVHEEHAKYGDIELIDAEENKYTLCLKRFLALRWAATTPKENYDFFFTADSDSFVRLAAMSRRMHHRRPNLLRPRETFVMWGDMKAAWLHWRKHDDPTKPDIQYDGEWYDFPIGMGYLMSSALTAHLDNVSELLPHRVPYYSDDVLIGSWVAEHAPGTLLISDKGGFHDPPLHGTQPFPIDYSTTLVHHIDISEMQQLREMSQFKDEWLSRGES
ncbi:hypothetical protein AURDEDRAFT_171782 [Auricularia subglabra TFB-10046 SS5]|nr:hypothetical protein AURDEDRAFT_171782 [Auricularia subglabra TFB-10046 SS5]